MGGKMKKFVSLFLVFSVFALSMPLSSKEKKGADLIIQRTDGTQVRGELIAVKGNSLFLLERDSRGDVSVELSDIERIRIVKKAMTVGIVGGLGAGFMIGAAEAKGGMGSAVGGGMMLGVVIGALVGAVAGTDKKIQLEGKSASEIQEILETLRKKVRIKNAQ